MWISARFPEMELNFRRVRKTSINSNILPVMLLCNVWKWWKTARKLALIIWKVFYPQTCYLESLGLLQPCRRLISWKYVANCCACPSEKCIKPVLLMLSLKPWYGLMRGSIFLLRCPVGSSWVLSDTCTHEDTFCGSWSGIWVSSGVQEYHVGHRFHGFKCLDAGVWRVFRFWRSQRSLSSHKSLLDLS